MNKDKKEHLIKEDIQMKKHMERSSTLAIREIQIKTTMRYHYTYTRMNDTKTSNAGEEGEIRPHGLLVTL